ncbi:hypothetical protein DSECCO2_42310 [anaerobic digester metagenome]
MVTLKINWNNDTSMTNETAGIGEMNFFKVGIDLYCDPSYTILVYNILVREWNDVNDRFNDIGGSDPKADERI